MVIFSVRFPEECKNIAKSMAGEERTGGVRTLRRDAELRDVFISNLVVPTAVCFKLSGVMIGDLIVDPGGVASIYGTVNGAIINLGGKVELFGAADAIRDLDPSSPTRVAPSG